MPTPRILSRFTAVSLSVGLAGTLGIAVGITGTALGTPSVAHAASAIGGPIASDEMFTRAQNWVNQGITYTQTGPWASDGAGSTYRRDCSGLVSMAWHLPNLGLPNGTGNSPVTGDFQHSHDASHPWTPVPGGVNGFQPGDAMVKDGHIELFVQWVTPSNHQNGAYVYSFNSDGETVQNPYANSTFGNRGKNSWTDLLNYDPIRYDKVIDGSSTRHVTSDFDGDGKSDPAVFRPSTGDWMAVYGSSGQSLASGWGGAGDIPVVGDYNGDGKTDIAMFRPSNGTWYEVDNGTGNPRTLQAAWGGVGDVPIVGDYDGDGKTDIAVFRPSTGEWLVTYTSTGGHAIIASGWGGAGDIPVVGDYNGDGKTDIAMFRPSNGTWYEVDNGTGNPRTLQAAWGGVGDVPIVGDYDGDGKTDIAVFRPSTGEWLVTYTSTGGHAIIASGWGGAGDIPVVGDYNGDGKTDIAMFRPSNGTWYEVDNGTGNPRTLISGWGTTGDIPLAKPAAI